MRSADIYDSVEWEPTVWHPPVRLHEHRVPFERVERAAPREARLLTVKEAAQYVRVHPNTVYAAANSGRLRFRAIGRLRRFTIDDLDAWTRA